ncbi:MAG: FHA domain-containing protein [Clostridiales bacterium]|nr:FHA domain-containing protein [Clostridiales bacterium]
MTARERRLASDFEQIKKEFAGHKNIIVTPIGEEPPEKYHITYFVNGIYLQADGKPVTLGRHEVEIILHADYPRYKPVCRILTPIWHPNFRDGQICIGDIWGAGESLADIIINIGDMIQYKSWNSYSPLSADAAKWAMDNRHLFPVGNVELHAPDYASAKESVEIDLFDEEGNMAEDDDKTVGVFAPLKTESNDERANPVAEAEKNDGNDFEITAEELANVQFVPSAQRMQAIRPAGATVKGGQSVNLKTVLMKGLLWALIGAILGFGITEITGFADSDESTARIMGYSHLASYYDYYEKAIDIYDENSSQALEYYDMAKDELEDSYYYEFHENEDKMRDTIKMIPMFGTAMWSGLLALFLGLALGVGEGVFYGSKEKALLYGAIGAGISLALGFISGLIAQIMYAGLLENDTPDLIASFIRGIAWSIMGLGIGLAAGLIKPQMKRILFCSLGGLGGGFIGGFIFDFICDIIPDDAAARCIGIITMGILIGLGVGLLEQFAKQAWLKVIRGEFEGKEYLVFAGTTSIGNSGKNTIVLFKDRLVGPHHCDIILEGSKYVLVDCGTPMGTIVNGMKTNRHILKQGDTISIGNSVLVFNTK